MFKFGFLNCDTCATENSDVTGITHQELLEAKEIVPDSHIFKQITDAGYINVHKYVNNIKVKHVTSNVTHLLSNVNSPVFNAEKNHSDLQSGIYEGGAKIWECTHDLINYIVEQPVSFKDKKVLDLGCGAGIIGILTLINGCSNVCFQDYNEEVIRYITIPNVFLNTEEDQVYNKCKFYSGDWDSFLTLTENEVFTENNKYDYIFTCETIYNTSNYEKLHNVFEKKLKQSGIIYLAAKAHYFGVGGGLRQFEDFLTEKAKFNFSICWKCSEGLHREILKITFKTLNT